MPLYKSTPERDVEVYATDLGCIALKSYDEIMEEDVIVYLSIRQAKQLFDDLPTLISDARACLEAHLKGGDDAESSNP